MSAVCVSATVQGKINKSACHLYAPFDRHYTVHLGVESKYLQLELKNPASAASGELTQKNYQYTGQTSSCGLLHQSPKNKG